MSVAKREREMQLRELTDQAHGANLDLGHALVHDLAAVDPDDINVARFFVLCGHPHRANYADTVTMPRWALSDPVERALAGFSSSPEAEVSA